MTLELGESFFGFAAAGPIHLDNVEGDGLTKGPAFTDGDSIANLDITEAGRHMDRNILMPPFEPLVFPHIFHVITTNNNGSIHLHLDHSPGQDTATDSNIAGEGALLVDISTQYSLFRRSITQAN